MTVESTVTNMLGKAFWEHWDAVGEDGVGRARTWARVDYLSTDSVHLREQSIRTIRAERNLLVDIVWEIAGRFWRACLASGGAFGVCFFSHCPWHDHKDTASLVTPALVWIFSSGLSGTNLCIHILGRLPRATSQKPGVGPHGFWRPLDLVCWRLWASLAATEGRQRLEPSLWLLFVGAVVA